MPSVRSELHVHFSQHLDTPISVFFLWKLACYQPTASKSAQNAVLPRNREKGKILVCAKMKVGGARC